MRRNVNAIVRASLILLLSAGTGVVCQPVQDAVGRLGDVSCDGRWSLGGFRLGMTIEQVRMELASGEGRFRRVESLDVADRESVYSWCGAGKDGSDSSCQDPDKYRLIVAERSVSTPEGDELRREIVSVRLNLDPRDVRWEAIREVLHDRWGESDNEVDEHSPQSDSIVAIHGQRLLWNDEVCDVRATLSLETASSFWEQKSSLKMSVIVERLSRVQRSEMMSYEKAIELLNP
ncbi:MAG: hypothetical protein JSV80_02320 [Acidobacteriota bacterium]|nr:MAG: hypothetical protein JSV80_02320 [Acidobacteriota bacterium]